MSGPTVVCNKDVSSIKGGDDISSVLFISDHEKDLFELLDGRISPGLNLVWSFDGMLNTDEDKNPWTPTMTSKDEEDDESNHNSTNCHDKETRTSDNLLLPPQCSDDLPQDKAGVAKPKRPVSAYNLFFKKRRRELVVDDRTITFSKIGKIIGKEWQETCEKERAQYQRLAKRDQLRYRQEIAIWTKEQRQRCRPCFTSSHPARPPPPQQQEQRQRRCEYHHDRNTPTRSINNLHRRRGYCSESRATTTSNPTRPPRAVFVQQSSLDREVVMSPSPSHHHRHRYTPSPMSSSLESAPSVPECPRSSPASAMPCTTPSKAASATFISFPPITGSSPLPSTPWGHVRYQHVAEYHYTDMHHHHGPAGQSLFPPPPPPFVPHDWGAEETMSGSSRRHDAYAYDHPHCQPRPLPRKGNGSWPVSPPAITDSQRSHDSRNDAPTSYCHHQVVPYPCCKEYNNGSY